MGFCPACRERAPLVQAPSSSRRERRSWAGEAPPAPKELSTVDTDDHDRIPLAFSELNRVLGGGVVPGSVVLMAGEPGVGKSTMLLQTAQGLAAGGGSVLYVSGEESVSQIKSRSDRLGFSGRGVYMLAETNADEVVRHLEEFRPALAMVDSVQTLYCDDLPSGAGSVAQVRESTLRIMRWAKTSAIPVVMTGHVTKEGSLAGPRVLEHMVDAVVHLEGDGTGEYRILRGSKNRFGSTDEVGIFQMGGGGLEEVPDPSRVLLANRLEGAVGSTIVPVLEGSRPLLVEVQALTAPSVLPAPRRVANGLDYNRLLMLAAVLGRRGGAGPGQPGRDRERGGRAQAPGPLLGPGGGPCHRLQRAQRPRTAPDRRRGRGGAQRRAEGRFPVAAAAERGLQARLPVLRLSRSRGGWAGRAGGPTHDLPDLAGRHLLGAAPGPRRGLLGDGLR